MTLDELRGLLGETDLVEAAGARWPVGDPTYTESIEVQRCYSAWARETDPEDAAASAQAWGKAARLAVMACLRVEGLEGRPDDDTAGRILMRTGGPGGALAKACLRRCGCTVPELDGEGAEDVDPTSTH